jgi:endonuclease G, mitochondrial
MLSAPRRLSAICLVAALMFHSGCWWRQPEVRLDNPADPRLPFGNPSNATADFSNADNYLLIKPTYVISYNNSRGTPNWVAWRTTEADIGGDSPRPEFQPDPDLPAGFVRVTPSDYTGSGYDRGHMLPNADRQGSPEANAETFFMTNIVPQVPDLNRFVWEKLERYARSIVRRGNDVYTFAGVYGAGKRLRNKVTVPTNCWKIIVIILSGGPIQVDPSTRVIAVDMPNQKGIADANWRQYLTTVRDIEQKTGLNFFSALPPDLQETLETRPDPLSSRERDE